MDSQDKISVSFNTYPISERYLPLLLDLGDRLCFYYGEGIPRGRIMPENLSSKTHLTKVPSRFVGFIVSHILRLFNLPLYNAYWYKVQLLDIWFSRKVSKDDSKIVFTTPLFPRTVKKAKKAGKFVVLEAGNSEPAREYNRIIKEYEYFAIRNKYIYGDTKYKNTCLKSFELADKIITISEVSEKTYREAGYDIGKLKLIPMSGTNFPISSIDSSFEKPRAFISTAFHNFIKGSHRMLLAWKKAQIKDIPLIMVGRLCEDMHEFIDKYGPFENVILEGYVQGCLIDYYNNYDAVGILMSLSEGAVRTTPELMSFGFPMIVSPDATCDIVKDGINGYVIETTDIDSLAERMRWFAEDWGRVHAMREKVLQSISKRSINNYSIEVSNYLKEVTIS